MKKLVYTFFLLFVLFITSIKINNVSTIRAGVKVIGKCCKELSGNGHDRGRVMKTNKETRDDDYNATSIFPASFWDTKSMIW